jgi:glycosyltransferase involved in cell wall biosynthesis
MAREELAEMVAPLTAAELLQQLELELQTEIKLVPGQHQSLVRRNRRILKFLRFGIGKRAIFDLAWLYANQNIDEDDLEKAMLVYRWCEKKYGLKSFSHMHKTDLALLAIRLGDQELAERAIQTNRNPLSFILWFQPRKLAMKPALGFIEALNVFFGSGIDLSIRPGFLKADVKNPFRNQQEPLEFIRQRRSEANRFMSRLSRAIIPQDVAPLSLTEEPELSVFDSLSVAGEIGQVTEGPKVTVVMSSYRPGTALLSAAKSVLASSYQNLELLIIDDASGAEFDEILNEAQELDSRVRVLRQSENGGTYRIRNRALDEATGELITFHDSDDWLHPQRIEKQVKWLVKSGKVGNISMSTRLTDNLEAAQSIRRLRIGLCEPSLLFWKERALEKVGYFDTVRKGGDSEYRRRLERAFKQDLDVIDPYRCLTIQRADNGGLTAGDLGFRWIVDFRLTYRDSFNHFQRSTSDLRYSDPEQRRFYAPRPMRIPRSQDSKVREFDLVIGANGHDAKNSKEFVRLATEAIECGKRVGFWQINSMYPLSNPRTLRPEILDLLQSGALESVYSSDNLRISELRLIAPSSFLNSYYPLGYNWQVDNRSLISVSEAVEGWQAKGEGVESAVSLRFSELGSDSKPQ